MSTFKDREEAFENLYAHDQEQIFRARARRNMSLAAWAAQQMGRSSEETASYVNEIVAVDLLEGKDEPILQRIQKDLETSGHPAGETELKARMGLLMDEALRDIRASEREA